MDKTTPISRALFRSVLFGLVRGASWAAGSTLVTYIVWWVQRG
jgi:hypothetical protein